MELKMKAICEGRKSRREVIDETIHQYRAVYVRTQQRLSVMKEVSIRLPLH
jgi:DNA topoisomerase III